MKAAIVYLVVISGAEIVTNFTHILGGIVAHVVILISLLVYSALRVGYPDHKLFLALTLSSLTRIISLAIPMTPFSQLPVIFAYAIIYPILMVGAWVTMRRANYTPYEVGLNARKPRLQMLISLSGVVLGVTEYIILRPAEAIVPSLTVGWGLASFAILLLGTGLVEEFIFRGVGQKAAVEALGKWGIPYMSYIFAILHLIHHSPVDIIFVLVVALYFGWLVSKTGSLMGVIIAHGFTNFLLYVIIPSILRA